MATQAYGYLLAFTCIPTILNEYWTAEPNVRMGCLKVLTFVFEYVGPQSAYYVDSVVTMLEDALTERDLVRRQTASIIAKHLALGCVGLGCEDTMLHLMNLVWPNGFETSPHIIGTVIGAIEAMGPALGPGVLLSYTLQGLFHQARTVCEVRLLYGTSFSNADLRHLGTGILVCLQFTVSWCC